MYRREKLFNICQDVRVYLPPSCSDTWAQLSKKITTNLYCKIVRLPSLVGKPGKFSFKYSWREASSNLCSGRTRDKPEPEPSILCFLVSSPVSWAILWTIAHNALRVLPIQRPSWNFDRVAHDKTTNTSWWETRLLHRTFTITFYLQIIIVICVCHFTDTVYFDPKSSGQNKASKMVHEFWWWRETKTDRRSPCSGYCQRCQAHKLCRGMIENKGRFLFNPFPPYLVMQVVSIYQLMRRSTSPQLSSGIWTFEAWFDWISPTPWAKKPFKCPTQI